MGDAVKQLKELLREEKREVVPEFLSIITKTNKLAVEFGLDFAIPSYGDTAKPK